MYLLYNLALALAIILGTPVWIYKVLRHQKYRIGLAERLGRVPTRLLGSRSQAARSQDLIWIHAVSVGEVLAISQLVAELKVRLPGHHIVVSTTTVTGQNLARARFGADSVFFFPLDIGLCIRPYLRALRPQLVVMAETEFWPNFLRYAAKAGARIAVVNARISDQSLPGYTRWQRLLHDVLAKVDLFLAQSEEDQRRLIAIGAPQPRVHVSGNLKFDVEIAGERAMLEAIVKQMELRAEGSFRQPASGITAFAHDDGHAQLFCDQKRFVAEFARGTLRIDEMDPLALPAIAAGEDIEGNPALLQLFAQPDDEWGLAGPTDGDVPHTYDWPDQTVYTQPATIVERITECGGSTIEQREWEE